MKKYGLASGCLRTGLWKSTNKLASAEAPTVLSNSVNRTVGAAMSAKYPRSNRDGLASGLPENESLGPDG